MSAEAMLTGMAAVTKAMAAAKRNQHEDGLAFQLKARGLPPFEREFYFGKPRRWRFDFAWVEQKIAVEVEGLVVTKNAAGQTVVRGRHASIDGFKDDCEKYAWAAVLGWTVMRFEQSQVRHGIALDMIERLFAARGFKR